MKVLYVLRYYPTLTETFIYREITGLLERGIDIIVLAIGQREDGAMADELPLVEVWRPPRGLGAMPLLRFSARVMTPPPGLSRKHAMRVAWAADRALQWGASRVHAHFAGEASIWARAIARRIGVPYSCTAHATDLFRPHELAAGLMRDARPLVAVSRDGVRRARELAGIEAKLIRCGVALGRYRQTTAQSRSILRIISVARWVPKKGLDLLLDVVSTLSFPYELRLVSTPPSGTVLPAGVHAGRVPPSHVPALLYGADVFVLPCRVASDGDRDGVPVAVIEAMAAGLPVITTSVGGLGDLVDSTVGWVVPPDDPRALRDALGAARDTGARGLRGQEARRRVAAGWTLAAQVDALLLAWEGSCAAR